MTGILIKAENLDIDARTEKVSVTRHREEIAIYKPRTEAQTRSSPHSPQKEPTLPP